MANKIQFKRGVKANLPTLSVAEPAFTTDTNQLFIGNGTTNIELAKATDLSDIMQDRIYYCGTTSGTNTYTATNSKITAYTDGLTVRIKIGTASTGASTLNINGLGAKTILDTLGNTITSGGLKAGLPYQLCYNGTNFIVLGKGGGGTATADKILSPYTATNDSGQVTGTIPSKTAATYNPSTSVQTIASGQYLSEAQTIAATAGTANVSQVLSGYTFNSANGIGLTGNIPSMNPTWGDQAEITNISVGAYSYGNGANYAYFNVPSGNYLNGVNWISHYEPYLLAQNIVSGASICGVAGSATPTSMGGKKYATGSGTTTNNAIYARTQGATTNGITVHYVQITGFNFTPTIVIIKFARGNPSYDYTTFQYILTQTMIDLSGISRVAPAIVSQDNYAGNPADIGAAVGYFPMAGFGQIVFSYGNIIVPLQYNGAQSYTYEIYGY